LAPFWPHGLGDNRGRPRGDMIHRLADAARWTEGLVGPCRCRRSAHPCPVVHVLEDLAVDRSQVREIV
jgi:hypothetical protein